MKQRISVNIGKLKLKNPVMVASGTFGYAEEFKDFFNLKELGAIVTKTITLNARQGNPMPRTCETPAGMLNSIGLENPGIDKFIKEKLPELEKTGVPVIVSIASDKSLEEFIELVHKLNKESAVSAIELNISCPNVKPPVTGHRSPVTGLRSKTGDQRLISQDKKATFEVVKSVRRITKKALITKLSPNVTDIVEIAQAAEEAGSDSIALINTLIGMSIDIDSKTPKIAKVSAGLSGPAIRPIAVRMVWEVFNKVKIPIIGMGGITDIASALEFILAGSTAISIGTANFINPRISIEVIEGLKKYMQENKVANIKELTGALKCQE